MIRVHFPARSTAPSFAGRASSRSAASFSAALLVGALAAFACSPAAAQQRPGNKPAAAAPQDPGKPALVQSYGDWGAYAAKGAKARTCYALASPKERLPAALKRDPAFIFVSQRPAEGVRNEISFIMGFDVKPGSAPKAEIGNASFDLVAKGGNLWIKNAADEARALDAMRKGARIVVKAQSLRGNLTTDSYSLSGLSQALERVQKECQ